VERVQVHDFLWSLGKLERVYTARSTCSDRSATMDKTESKRMLQGLLACISAPKGKREKEEIKASG